MVRFALLFYMLFISSITFSTEGACLLLQNYSYFSAIDPKLESFLKNEVKRFSVINEDKNLNISIDHPFHERAFVGSFRSGFEKILPAFNFNKAYNMTAKSMGTGAISYTIDQDGKSRSFSARLTSPLPFEIRTMAEFLSELYNGNTWQAENYVAPKAPEQIERMMLDEIGSLGIPIQEIASLRQGFGRTSNTSDEQSFIIKTYDNIEHTFSIFFPRRN